ncbi:MAG: hypothetical protein U5O39_04960 [Gammaproteobacteria bacterium]|nr:hypothetical protein [Gammaproteobacteria bacterium]
MTPENMMAAFEDSDFEKMEEIRKRAEQLVEDEDTAEDLKAWYRQLCKRPCFHDEYLQAFNNPNTHLVDTDGKGVDKITEKGVVARGEEYELDCLIYASGFEVGTPFERRAGFDPAGKGGQRLSQYWSEGMRTKHGIHVHGFPNMFIVQPTQGANLISNVPHNLTESGKTIASIVKHAMDTKTKEVEVTERSRGRTGWTCSSPARRECSAHRTARQATTTTRVRTRARPHRYNVGYPQGAMAFFLYLDEWRNFGDFEGLEFR